MRSSHHIMNVSKAVVLLFIIEFTAALLTPPTTYASATVGDVLSVEDVLLVTDQDGNVLGLYPQNLYIEHLYTHAYGTNDSGKVEYKVVDCSWGLAVPWGRSAEHRLHT